MWYIGIQREKKREIWYPHCIQLQIYSHCYCAEVILRAHIFAIPPKKYLYLYCCNNIIRTARVIFFSCVACSLYPNARTFAKQSYSRSRLNTNQHSLVRTHIHPKKLLLSVLSVQMKYVYACYLFGTRLSYYYRSRITTNYFLSIQMAEKNKINEREHQSSKNGFAHFCRIKFNIHTVRINECVRH